MANSRSDKEKIIELWESKVRKELPATRTQEHLALLDTLPLFLDQMDDALSEKSVKERIEHEVTQIAELHGETRAEIGSYTLAQVLLEYRILREAVFAVLETENLLSTEKREVIFNSFQTAITGAASEFMRVKVFRLKAAQGQAELYAKSLQDLESVTEAALSQGTSYQNMLHALLGRIRAIFDCDTVAIYTLSEDGRALVACAAHGLEDDVKGAVRIPSDQGVIGSILSNEGNPLSIDDVSQVEIVSPALRSRNIRSLLGITLKADKKIIGVIHLGSLLPRQFSERDQGLFVLIAERIAVAMDNARQFEESKDDLEKSRAESALRGRYVSLLSHDIRNPITAAKMNSELLVRQKGRPEVVAQLSQRITENLIRADKLIKDLLDVNRILSGRELSLETTPFEMGALVVEVVAGLTSAADYERFVFHPKGTVEVTLSRPEIQRAIEIILKCGLRFGDRSRPILILLQPKVGDQATSTPMVELSICFEGRELSQEEISSLSQPPKTAAPEHGAERDFTMELTLMGGIIRGHGGTVTVNGPTADEKQTILRVELPKVARSVAHSQAA